MSPGDKYIWMRSPKGDGRRNKAVPIEVEIVKLHLNSAHVKYFDNGHEHLRLVRYSSLIEISEMNSEARP